MIPGASIFAAEYVAGFLLYYASSSPAPTAIGRIDFTDGLPKYYLKQGETARYFYDLVEVNDAAIDLTGATVVLNLKVAGGTVLPFTGEVLEASEGTIKYQPIEGDLDVVGVYDAEWRITLQGGALLIWPTDGTHKVQILDDLA